MRVLILLSCLPLTSGLVGCSVGPAASAVIVRQGVLSREGIGKFEAIAVHNADAVKQLEAFFPDYRSLPASDAVVGWKGGYEVYFNTAGGRAVRVMSNGEYWNVGKGDFRVVGDLNGFVKQLQQNAEPRITK